MGDRRPSSEEGLSLPTNAPSAEATRRHTSQAGGFAPCSLFHTHGGGLEPYFTEAAAPEL